MNPQKLGPLWRVRVIGFDTENNVSHPVAEMKQSTHLRSLP